MPDPGERVFLNDEESAATRASRAAEVVEFLPAAGKNLPAPSVDADCAVQPPASVQSQAPHERAAPAPVRRTVWRRVLWAPFRFCGWLARTLFGLASLLFLLSVVAAVPMVNFIALGYLLEVEGRLARSGKLRDALPLLDLAPRLGSIVLGVWAWLLPLRLLANVATDARLIDPGSSSDVALHGSLAALRFVVGAHICLALARGGSLGCFLRPVKNLTWLIKQLRAGSYWSTAEASLREFLSRLRLPHLFWLGVRGYAGAFLWLVIPTGLFAAANTTDGPLLLVTLLGALLLMLVLSWVPFLQAHFAAENRFRAMFALGTVRRLYKAAPFSWLITMLITLTLALPMYLFKVVLPPQDAMFLVTPVFIASIYPAKVLSGWAYHRALMRERRAYFALRWLSRLVLVPLLALFVFLLFFTQFIGEHGKGVLFEHHAFLLPVPFGLAR
jgi:hypothetical protein